jgi:hypothetical protein
MKEGRRHALYSGFYLAPHFNTGKQTTRFLVHHNRPYMQNMGFLMVEHGEDADA